MAKYFSGFSTVDRISPPYTLVDIELVKQDILNQFHTVKGERVMMPSFGSNIPKLLMDPMDEITIDAIIADAMEVVRSDPRVRLIDIQPYTDEQTITLSILLDFIPQEVRETLYVLFSIQSQEAY